MNDLTNISVFRNYFDPDPKFEISLRDFCLNVQNGDYKKEIISLRQLTDKKQRDQIKKNLPAVTVSGTFAQKRAKENIIIHSGFICLDFDAKGNESISDWPALRNSLAGIENVYFSALSASGQGVFLIIPISTPEKHESHFTALAIDFKSIGLTIDKACKDVSRLRGMSYDSKAVLNPNAKTYRRVYVPPQPKPYTHSTNSPKIEKLIQWTERKVTFTKGNRHEFIKQLAGACHRFGIFQNETLCELLRYQQPDFTPKEIEKIIDYMYSNQQFLATAIRP